MSLGLKSSLRLRLLQHAARLIALLGGRMIYVHTGGVMRNGSRILSRIALGISFLLAAAIPFAAFVIRGPSQPETWAVAAAALAVMTSVISTWSSRRVLELQEDSQRPNPYPTIDVNSRHQLAMLRIKNTGGTPAHNVSLDWDTALLDHDGNKIGFSTESDVPSITTLLPGESISQIITVTHEFIKNHPEGDFTGRIKFEDASGLKYKKNFRLDGRQYARSPTYDEEGPRTHYQLQKIPEELNGIRRLLEKLAR